MRGGKAEPVVEAMRIAARAIGGELQKRAAGGAGAGLGIMDQRGADILAAMAGRDAHALDLGAAGGG